MSDTDPLSFASVVEALRPHGTAIATGTGISINNTVDTFTIDRSKDIDCIKNRGNTEEEQERERRISSEIIAKASFKWNPYQNIPRISELQPYNGTVVVVTIDAIHRDIRYNKNDTLTYNERLNRWVYGLYNGDPFINPSAITANTLHVSTKGEVGPTGDVGLKGPSGCPVGEVGPTGEVGQVGPGNSEGKREEALNNPANHAATIDEALKKWSNAVYPSAILTTKDVKIEAVKSPEYINITLTFTKKEGIRLIPFSEQNKEPEEKVVVVENMEIKDVGGNNAALLSSKTTYYPSGETKSTAVVQKESKNWFNTVTDSSIMLGGFFGEE